MHLDMDQLRDIVGRINDKYARRDTRSAVKGYMKERLPETREEAQARAGNIQDPGTEKVEVRGTEQVEAGTTDEVALRARPPAVRRTVK